MNINSEFDLEKNKSICIYPFIHSYVGSRYERKLCCVSDDLEEYTKTSLAEFWNSEKMKQTRLDMLAGKPIKECSRCYDYEKLGVPSLRQEATFKDHIFTKVNTDVNEDGSMKEGPSYFDHRTIHCNLQCLSCGTTYSSTHIQLQKDMWNMGTEFVVDYNYERGSANEIIEAIRNKNCTSIYWAGGEPFMSHVHWAVVEEMYNLGQNPEYREYIQNIRVHYNTNLSKSVWKNKRIVDLIDFYQPSIQASIDGTFETFEYCRDGGVWTETAENWKEYHSRINKNNQMGIASVLSAPVIFDIDRWFDFFEPYDPIVYNHKYVWDMSNIPDRTINLLDIRLYPKHIVENAINHAIERFDKCKLRGKEKSIQILQSYLIEREENLEIFENQKSLQAIKGRVLFRDKFLKTPRAFLNVLNVINPEAARWYHSL